MKLYDELIERGLIESITDNALIDKLNNGSLTFYIGTDPTSDSLHIGHYSSFLIASRLKKCGHKPILLVGGATGLIGDPKPNAERPMITKEMLNDNYIKLRKQIETLFGFEVVNNFDWSKDINFIDYLRDYGKYFNLNYMLNKETVKSRLDIGITYTEFSYMIMQSLDFLYLYEHNNCELQIGGSDQWGNITSGIELIRKKIGKEAYGLTAPLILKSDGTKFGKSESGESIWLDKDKTTPYEMYQYLLNVDDNIVIDYLKKLTFIPLDDIKNIEKSMKEEPHLRLAQKMLANEIVRFVHGEKLLENAKNITQALFENNIKSLSVKELEDTFKGTASSLVDENISVVDLLLTMNICQSKREAREFINNGAITINGEKITDLERIIDNSYFIDRYIVLRKGKKNYYLGIKKNG